MDYKKLEQIKTLIFDVDGVLTNSQLLITEEGDLLRSMNTRDGYGLKRAIDAGLNVIIITGGNSLGVRRRLQLLGINQCHDNIKDKFSLLTSIIEENLLNKDEIMYMGDDIPDLKCMEFVGLPACPADAVAEIQKTSEFISDYNGGSGCVRDIVEKILQVKNLW